MRERLTVAEALAAVMAAAPGREALPVEEVPVAGAHGRVLARDARAPVALPPWDNASMDGWAVRAVDVLGARADAPVTLRRVGAVPAGATWRGTVGAGEAVRIATGAPVPDGADAVVRVEDTAPAGDDRVLVRDDRDARATTTAGGASRRNVRPRGEDVAAGAVAIPAGTRLGAGALALLAATGHATLPVTAVPRVALVGSGDELVDVAHYEAVREGRGVVASNALMLAALVRAGGGEPVDLGTVPDTLDALCDRLGEAIHRGASLVLTTGGVSVGERDHARAAVQALGGTLHFWRVRMRPGGPLAFGTLPGPHGPVPWLGLPGNPVSTLVTCELFARPLLAALAGDARPHRRALAATLAEPVQAAAPLAHYLRVTLATDAAGALLARPTGAQGSGLLTSAARAEGLLVLPEGVTALDVGAPVHVLPLAEGMVPALAAALPDPRALAIAGAPA